MKNYWTMRPQNRCESCHYTWHPRGKSLSLRCPNCGSQHTVIVYNGCSKTGLNGCIGLILIVFLSCGMFSMFGFLIGGKKNKETQGANRTIHEEQNKKIANNTNVGIDNQKANDSQITSREILPYPIIIGNAKPTECHVIFQTDVAIIRNAVVWIEVDGVKVSDWKPGSKSVDIKISRAKHKVEVKSRYNGSVILVHSQEYDLLNRETVTITIKSKK